MIQIASQDQASEFFWQFRTPEIFTGRRIEGVPDDEESDKYCGYFAPPRDMKLVEVQFLYSEGFLPRQKEPGIADLVLLSEKLKGHIPDRNVFMVALQGYPATQKDRPHGAVECAVSDRGTLNLS